VAESELNVRNDPERGRYELTVDGAPAGIITYRRDGDVLVLQHTEVDDAYEGQGLGGEFAARVLDDVRADALRIRPDCPFIRHFLDEHPEYGDLVVPAGRS
jgi:predicted GNAT family acetyltransferase